MRNFRKFAIGGILGLSLSYVLGCATLVVACRLATSDLASPACDKLEEALGDSQ